MTIASTESRTIYAGNGSTTEFAVPFMFLRDDDIEVVLSTEDEEMVQIISTDYNLSGAGEQTGGVCSMNQAPPVGRALVIRRNPSLVQEVDYVENDAFPAATHEAALDKLTMICQALSERLDRTITFRVSSAVTGVEVPEPKAGKVLAWNESGNNLINKDGAALGMVTLPLTVSEGGTGCSSGEEALANLGCGTVGRSVAQAETTTSALAAMDAEPADTSILKSDLNDLLQAVYGDEAQVHTGTDLSGLTVERNHISWTLSADSQFSEVVLPYDGTYVFHVYPAGYALILAESYKGLEGKPLPLAGAGEVRLALEQFNGRKTILSICNVGV
jgi:hypothetical protein